MHNADLTFGSFDRVPLSYLTRWLPYITFCLLFLNLLQTLELIFKTWTQLTRPDEALLREKVGTATPFRRFLSFTVRIIFIALGLCFTIALFVWAILPVVIALIAYQKQ